MKKMEIYKRVNGYEEAYEVSNLGNVRSIDRFTPKYKVFLKGQGIKPQYNHDGRVYVALSDGLPTKFFIARLVLEHFDRKPKENEIVIYKNGNKKDLNIKNLSWGNKKDVIPKKPTESFTIREKKVIKELIAQGKTNIEIAKMFGVSHRMISRVRVNLRNR